MRRGLRKRRQRTRRLTQRPQRMTPPGIKGRQGMSKLGHTGERNFQKIDQPVNQPKTRGRDLGLKSKNKREKRKRVNNRRHENLVNNQKCLPEPKALDHTVQVSPLILANGLKRERPSCEESAMPPQKQQETDVPDVGKHRLQHPKAKHRMRS